MAILNLVDKNDPILRQEMQKFDFANPPTDPIQLAKDLTETMIHNKGLGLAANQIGLPYRVFVLTGQKIIACFNPKVVDFSKELVYINESCLSYPGMVVKIKRSREIRARFTMPNGSTETVKFDGLTSRCYQHELDHLDGKVHLDMANQYHKDKAFKMQKAHDRILKRTAVR
jgi:peptide deformylase